MNKEIFDNLYHSVDLTNCEELTPQLRLEIYEKALIYYKKQAEDICYSPYGLCYSIDAVINYDNMLFDPYANMQTYIEIYKQKPNSINITTNYWFPRNDIKSRIIIFEKAIKKVKLLIK